jgi:hypothetical protein
VRHCTTEGCTSPPCAFGLCETHGVAYAARVFTAADKSADGACHGRRSCSSAVGFGARYRTRSTRAPTSHLVSAPLGILSAPLAFFLSVRSKSQAANIYNLNPNLARGLLQHRYPLQARNQKLLQNECGRPGYAVRCDVHMGFLLCWDGCRRGWVV